MKDIYSYQIGGKLYINLTNKCSNDCDFCVRKKPSYDGYYLWLTKEPTAEQVIKSIKNAGEYSEFVFCGYGEPTYKFDELVEVAKYLKQFKKPIRLNTNGQAQLILNKDVAKELAKWVDVVSISLNATSAQNYQKICKSVYGERAFDAILDFAKKCSKAGIKTFMSIVDIIGEEEIKKSEQIAKSCGATLKIRELI